MHFTAGNRQRQLDVVEQKFYRFTGLLVFRKKYHFMVK